jgi:hypothetical protein
VGVQVRWDKVGIELVDDHVFIWKGNNNYYLGIGTLMYKRIASPVKRVEYVSDGCHNTKTIGLMIFF